jgi:hypothetical protein
MIPDSNQQHLMLKEEVVDAVRAGKFHIWAVRTIDEGMAILSSPCVCPLVFLVVKGGGAAGGIPI